MLTSYLHVPLYVYAPIVHIEVLVFYKNYSLEIATMVIRIGILYNNTHSQGFHTVLTSGGLACQIIQLK